MDTKCFMVIGKFEEKAMRRLLPAIEAAVLIMFILVLTSCKDKTVEAFVPQQPAEVDVAQPIKKTLRSRMNIPDDLRRPSGLMSVLVRQVI